MTMALSMLPNPLVRKKSLNASFNSKATITTTTTTLPENQGANKDLDSGIQLTKKNSGIVTDNIKETKVVTNAMNDIMATNNTSPPPPQHGYPHPGYPGMMPMAPGMHPMFMMPPMPMGCYSYNCGPFPQAYGRGDSGSRSSGGWCYGGHPDITEIDVEDGVSFDSRDSCATLMCVEPLEQAGQLITKVLDSWANNVNSAMDYGENLCHPIDTNQKDDSNTPRKEIGLSETLLNVVKGHNEEVVASQNEKNVEVKEDVKVEETVQTADEGVKENKVVDNVSKEGRKGEYEDAEKVKKDQPIGFFQRMKHMNPIKTLDMSAISKDSEVNDLSGTADVNVVVSENQAQEAESKARNLDMKAADESSQKKNYFLNELSFEFSPEGVTIQEIAHDLQPKAPAVVDTNRIKVVSAEVESQSPIVASATNAKNGSKKMLKFPRATSRYAKLGAKEEVNESPFVASDVTLDANGFPILSQNCTKSSTWECAFSNSNPFASGDSLGVSSPVSVAAVFETRSCAWCGKGGTDTAAAKKLKLCSACQTTYYCSADCQSKDWVDGHSKTCHPII